MTILNRATRRIYSIVWQCKMHIYHAVLRLTGQFPAAQKSGNSSSGKVIYLTFDDGPSLHTGRLLEILDRYNVKATFFVTTGPNHLDLLPKIAAAGHSIGNHTANHDYKTLYASEETFLEALCKMEKVILDKTGIRPTLFRFPGGSESIAYHSSHKDMAYRLTALVQDRGYQYFDWNLDSRDTAEARTPGAVYRNVTSGVRSRKSTVVLQHDIKKYSVDAAEAIIVWGLKNGYAFLPLGADSPAVHHQIKS